MCKDLCVTLHSFSGISLSFGCHSFPLEDDFFFLYIYYPEQILCGSLCRILLWASCISMMAIHSSTSTRTSSHTAGFHSVLVFWPAGEAATNLWLFPDYATHSSSFKSLFSGLRGGLRVKESWWLLKRIQVHFPISMWSVTPAGGDLTLLPLFWRVRACGTHTCSQKFMFIK